MMAYPNASPYRVALGRAAKVVLIKSNGVCDAEQSLREIIEQDVSTFFIERGLTNKVLHIGTKGIENCFLSYDAVLWWIEVISGSNKLAKVAAEIGADGDFACFNGASQVKFEEQQLECDFRSYT
jgi:hypothetical protein